MSNNDDKRKQWGHTTAHLYSPSHLIIFAHAQTQRRRRGDSYFFAVESASFPSTTQRETDAHILHRMSQRDWWCSVGKEREGGADRCGGRREEKGGGGGSGLCVVCEDLCPSARGSVCTSSSVYLPSSWVSHFSPLTHSHLSPWVNIHSLRNAQSFSMHQDAQAAHWMYAMRTQHSICVLCHPLSVCTWIMYKLHCVKHDHAGNRKHFHPLAAATLSPGGIIWQTRS